jgi:hypothetical protein
MREHLAKNGVNILIPVWGTIFDHGIARPIFFGDLITKQLKIIQDGFVFEDFIAK